VNLFRIISWVLLLGATIMAGPNVPAQGLAAIREILVPAMRHLWTALAGKMPESRQA
jgi:hypothetical protein